MSIEDEREREKEEEEEEKSESQCKQWSVNTPEAIYYIITTLLFVFRLVTLHLVSRWRYLLVLAGQLLLTILIGTQAGLRLGQTTTLVNRNVERKDRTRPGYLNTLIIVLTSPADFMIL